MRRLMVWVWTTVLLSSSAGIGVQGRPVYVIDRGNDGVSRFTFHASRFGRPVYVVDRGNDGLSAARHQDDLDERRVLGHYMAWYKTPRSYGQGCSNPHARGEWQMWNQCGHDPQAITGTQGFRDIAAVRYPLIGPYDSADPRVIEYHLLQALAAEVDTLVIDFYGENDDRGIDEAARLVLQRVEEMNARYGTDLKIVLMYDGGALLDTAPSGRVSKAESDLDYMLRAYAGSPAYLWAGQKPAAFYFPKDELVLDDGFDGSDLDPARWEAVAGAPTVGDGQLTLAGGTARAEVQSQERFLYGVLQAAIQSSAWKSPGQATDSSFGFEVWTGANGQCHYGAILVANGHLGVLRSLPDAGGNCAGDPAYQAYLPVSNWEAVRAAGTVYVTLTWAPGGVALYVTDGGANSGQACYTGQAVPDVPLAIRLNADAGESYRIDHVHVRQPVLWPADLAALAQDWALGYPDFLPDCFPALDGSYAWVKADPWQEDGSNWGEPYLGWYYPTLDLRAAGVPTPGVPALTFGVGGVWAGFDDAGVGSEWSCEGHRWIDRQGGQVYDRTWAMLDAYNGGVGITYTLPVSWVQLATLNDYMEGTTLLASVETAGVDGVDAGYGGYRGGYQYVQQTEDHARAFKGLPGDSELDIYIAQHIYNARLASEVISNTAWIDDALDAFHSGHYTTAMALADKAAGIPAPVSVTVVSGGRTSGRVRDSPGNALHVRWQDRPEATLASGHRVYYGLAPGVYLSSTTVITGSSAVLTGLASNTTYYVAVTTLGAANPCETWYVSESWYADEIVAGTWMVFLPLVARSFY